MRRRDFIILLAGAMAGWPSALRTQQKAMPVVGYLSGDSAPSSPNPALTAFHEGLSETGYVEGQNLAMDYRWAEGHYDRLPALAADFVARKVDVIVPAGQAAALAAKTATSTIPIVFIGVGDPVGVGLVSSLARPGGNLTGFSNLATDLTRKRFELLSEPPCCTDRRCGRTEPDPCSGSCDADVLRAPEIQHSVQHVGRDGHLARLTPVRLRTKLLADDALPARDIDLHESSPAIPRRSLPAHATALANAS